MIWVEYNRELLGEVSTMPSMSDVLNIEGLKSYMTIGCPSIFLQSIDWWAWEMLMFITGSFGLKQQAFMIVIMNMATFWYRFGMGMDFSSSAILGNCVGAGQLGEVKHYESLFHIVMTIFMITLSLTQYLFKE